MTKQIPINLYNETFMVDVPNSVIIENLLKLKKDPKFIAPREAARLAKTHNRVRISGKGATDVKGNPVDSHKGNKLAYLNDISGDFKNSVANIVRNYKIDGHKVEVLYIDVITASNDAEPRDTLTPKKPIEQDKISTRESADKYAWYDVTAKIGEITVTTTEAYNLLRNDAVLATLVKDGRISKEQATELKANPFSGWLCWNDYDSALDASTDAPFNVADFVGFYAVVVVRALELVYYAKRAMLAQNGKPSK